MSTTPDPLAFVVAAARCPDCDSTVRQRPGPDGVLRLVVAHDPTCPTWQRGGATPTTYLTTTPKEEDR